MWFASDELELPKSVADGEVRTNTACHPGSAKARDIFENIEMERASESDWTFVAIVRENWTYPVFGPNRSMINTTRTTVYTNLAINRERARVYQCLYNVSSYFDAIEVNYPVLMSPIHLIPRALSALQIQEQFLRVSADMPVRRGPLTSENSRNASRVPIIKKDFDLRTTLLASPLVFQTRFNASARCPNREPLTYTAQWLGVQQKIMMSQKCAFPYLCDADTLRGQESIISCPGDNLRDEDELYGPAYSFGDERGWPEFLFSITDNGVLFRGDRLVKTSTLIDSSTNVLTIIFPFFTPEHGTSTILELRADFGGANPIKGQFKIRHYHLLAGTSWTSFAVWQLFVLLNLPMLIYDGVKAISISWRTYRTMEEKRKENTAAYNPPPLPSAGALFVPAVDLFSGFLMISYVCWNVKIKWESEAETSRLAGALSQIEWANADVAMDSKIDTYLTTINAYRSLISAQESCEALANFILYVNLLRVIQVL